MARFTSISPHPPPPPSGGLLLPWLLTGSHACPWRQVNRYLSGQTGLCQSGSPLGGGDGKLSCEAFSPCEGGQLRAAARAMVSLVGWLHLGSGVRWPCLHRRHFQTMVTYCSWSSTWQASAPRSACRRLGQLGLLQRMSCVDVTGRSCSLMDSLMDSLRAASFD